MNFLVIVRIKGGLYLSGLEIDTYLSPLNSFIFFWCIGSLVGKGNVLRLRGVIPREGLNPCSPLLIVEHQKKIFYSSYFQKIKI